MAMELGPDVCVNCVCPTTVNNDMGWQGFNRAADPHAAYEAFAAGSKLKRLPTNDDVIAAFASLASDGAGFMTSVACQSTAASRQEPDGRPRVEGRRGKIPYSASL